jgi:hypothetical protein
MSWNKRNNHNNVHGATIKNAIGVSNCTFIIWLILHLRELYSLCRHGFLQVGPFFTRFPFARLLLKPDMKICTPFQIYAIMFGLRRYGMEKESSLACLVLEAIRK